MKKVVLPLLAISLALGFSYSARADITLYDNGPVDGTVDAFSITNGEIVGDSFILTNNYTVTSVNFGAWNFPGDTISNVDWSITSDPYSGTTYGSGSAASVSTLTDYGFNNDGYDLTLDSFLTGPVDLLSGTYYLNLQNAVVSNGDPAYWDENNGPSSAFSSSLGSLVNYDLQPSTGSESFQILGTTNSLTTPEPSGIVSLMMGLTLVGYLISRRSLNMHRVLRRSVKTLTAFIIFAPIAILGGKPASAGVMMEGFYLDCPSGGSYQDWWDHLAQQTNTFALDGFSAIWIPCALKGASGGYSSGYDPFDDYDLGDKNQMGTIPTHYGTRQQLERMCAMMHANGLQVYEDIVDTHRDGDSGNFSFQYVNAYGTPNSGRFPKGPSDFYPNVPMESNTPDTVDYPDGRWIMPVTGGQTTINGQLWGWADYGMKESGNWITNALDLNGYRIDDVRASSWSWLYSWLNYGSMAGKYAVGENYDGSVSDLSTWVGADMQNRCSAFDFPLKFNYLNPMCNNPSGFNMASLVGAGFVGANPGGAVTFVENHDTDNSSNSIYQNKLLAYAYILTNEGYPCVYYRDWSTDSGSYGSGMQAGINNLMWIHEHIANGSTQQRWENNSIYVYERTGGSHLLTGLNTASYPQTITCATGFGPYWELHDYTGHEPDVWTDQYGNATITIPALNGGQGYCCYSVVGISGAFTAPQYSTTQEYDGAMDLDIPPADNTNFVNVGTIYAAAGTPISGSLTFDTTSWKSSTGPTATGTFIVLELLNPSGTVIGTRSYLSTTPQGTILGTTAPASGNYTYKIRSYNTPSNNQKPSYQLRITYTAPQS